MKMQKLGGYAAIASMCMLVIAGITKHLVVEKRVGDILDPAKWMAAYSAAPVPFYVNSIVFIVLYILMLIMGVALFERMRTNAPSHTRMMLIAQSAAAAMSIASEMAGLVAIGIIAPTRDASAYRAIQAMASGLTAMGYHTNGWACLLTGCAVLKTRLFPRILGWLSLFTGILWLPISIFPQPQVRPLKGIALLLLVVAIVWIGIALLRQKQPQPASREMSAAN